tara:strand:- start:236 stop:910 length:675 start_codon:yes stop_codon:yes gene_type:complete
MTYSILIPIFNEIRILPNLLDKLSKLDKKIEIILIDDGSNDGTKTILKKQKSFFCISIKKNSGKGFAIKEGLKIAKNENIIIVDGDLEIDIENIPILIQKYEKSGKKVLAGIRWEKNSNVKFEINTIGNYAINFFFNILYKTNLNDVLCCFKIINTDFLKSINIKSNGFEFEVETMAKIVLSKVSIMEEKVGYERRTIQEGKKLRISDAWKIIWVIIYFRLKSN